MVKRTELNKRYHLYDNLGTSLDRYTLVDITEYRLTEDGYRVYDCLSFSENLTAYCEHSECFIGWHLWKRINPFDFPRIQYIISEIF